MTRLSTPDLLQAVYRGDRAAVLAHLDAGGDVNVEDARGFTPLIVAMEGRHPELAAELLARGADARYRMPGGFSALHVLIKLIRHRPLNYSVTVERGGKKVTLTDPDEIRAATGGHPDDEYDAWLALAGKLVDGGVDIEAAKEATGQRALRDAAEVSSDLVALLLTRAGARVDATENYGFTPLHEAIINGRRDIARQLIAAGADATKQLARGYDKYHAGDDARAIAKKCGITDLFDESPTPAKKTAAKKTAAPAEKSSKKKS